MRRAEGAGRRAREEKATGRLWDEEGRPRGTKSQAQGGAVKALEGRRRSAPRLSVLHRQPVPRGASHGGHPPTLPKDKEPRLCAQGQPQSEAQAATSAIAPSPRGVQSSEAAGGGGSAVPTHFVRSGVAGAG